MPVISRARTLPAEADRLWAVVADPERLPEWWPRVERVEEASHEAWTAVLSTSRGRSLRADYTLTDSERPHRLRWRQELQESPFERILSSAVTELDLDPDGRRTVVRLTAQLELRGLSRFGGIQVRRATRRQLTAALDGLAKLVG